MVDQALAAHHPLSPPEDQDPGLETPVAALWATATATSRSGSPPDRGAYAADMLARLARESPDAAGSPGGTPSRTPLLSTRDAEVVADLLDELAGVHPHEELGQLAGSLSAQLWQRLAR